jgi:phenylacetate-CoA ligase
MLRTTPMNKPALLNSFYQNGFFRILDIVRRRDNIGRLRFLRRSQYWNKQELERWQLDKLNNLLAAAIHESPFHSKKLQKISFPLKTLQHIYDIPILTKSDIQKYYEEMRCSSFPKSECELSRTGGSTGEPTFYYLSRASKNWNRGCVYRSGEWAGIFLGDRTVQLTGSHFDEKEFKKIENRITLYLQRYRYYSVAVLTDEIMDSYYKKIRQFRPTSLWGYASALYVLSKFISKNYPTEEFSFIKAIITSSETLEKHQRLKIEEVFGKGKVYDHYGSREVYIACECPAHKGYHIQSEAIYLEVVNKNGDPAERGEHGRILITDLSNLAFPFIRYEIGDVGILGEESPCSCGVTLPKLESVVGRIADILVLKDRTLTPPNFTILMSDLKGIEAYQIYQKSIDKISIYLVINEQFNSGTAQYINDGLSCLIGTSAKYEIEYVKQIEVPPSGKRRYIISDVAHSEL